MKLYGGDAQDLEQLSIGDILTDELLHEACGLVWNGRSKVTIQLPTVQVKNLQDAIFLKPKLLLFTNEERCMLGVKISKIKIVKSVILKTKSGLEYTITTIACGKNKCEICTTID